MCSGSQPVPDAEKHLFDRVQLQLNQQLVELLLENRALKAQLIDIQSERLSLFSADFDALVDHYRRTVVAAALQNAINERRTRCRTESADPNSRTILLSNVPAILAPAVFFSKQTALAFEHKTAITEQQLLEHFAGEHYPVRVSDSTEKRVRGGLVAVWTTRSKITDPIVAPAHVRVSLRFTFGLFDTRHSDWLSAELFFAPARGHVRSNSI
jgi:hypothetical protein